jgi:phosphoglycerate dehydrogenase-like enzyme
VSTLPQTDATHHLLDRAALAKLSPRAYLINVGRGNVIDNAALIDALRDGRLGGAALDVFDEEPLPPVDPLWEAPNLRVTGHIAALSHPALIVPIFVDNFRRYIDGRPLRYVVDFDAGY